MKKNVAIKKTIAILLTLLLGMMVLSGCGEADEYVVKDGNHQETEDEGGNREAFEDDDDGQEESEDEDESREEAEDEGEDQEDPEEKAEELYKEKIRSIADISDYFSYKIMDIVDDEVPELLIYYYEKDERHGSFKIYACRGEELQEILDGTNDNLQVYQYDQSMAIVTRESYHDYEGYNYYQYDLGRYQLQAVECHNDAAENPHWYEDGNDNEISESEFNEIVADLRVGDRKDLDVDNWSSEIPN